MNLDTFLSPADAARAHQTLTMLRRHAASNFVLTGGLAIEAHLACHEIPASLRSLNDIDFLVDTFDQIPPSLATGLIFRHVHPNDAPGKTLLQSVHPQTGIRVDVFRANGLTTARAVPIEFHGLNWRIISIEDLIARLARLCLDLAFGVPMPAKHARDFLRLLPLAATDQMQSVWIDHRKPTHPELFSDAATQLAKLIAARPDLQIDLVYSQDLNATCPRCIDSGPFLLAEPQQVLSLLGYC